MDSPAISFHIAALIINLLAPLALVAVAILALRQRRRQGWLLIAAGAGLQFVAAGAIPVINYMLTLTAARMGIEATRRSITDTAAVGLLGSVVYALGFALMILGVLRLTKQNHKEVQR